MITIEYKNFDVNFSSISFMDIREAMDEYKKLQVSLGNDSDLIIVKTILSMAEDISKIVDKAHKYNAEISNIDKDKFGLLRKLFLALLSKPELNSGLTLNTKILTINLTDFLLKNGLIDNEYTRISIAYQDDCIDFTYSLKDMEVVDKYIGNVYTCPRCTAIEQFKELYDTSTTVSDNELYIYLLFIIASAKRQGLNILEGAMIDINCLDTKKEYSDCNLCTICKKSQPLPEM